MLWFTRLSLLDFVRSFWCGYVRAARFLYRGTCTLLVYWLLSPG